MLKNNNKNKWLESKMKKQVVMKYNKCKIKLVILK